MLMEIPLKTLSLTIYYLNIRIVQAAGCIRRHTPMHEVYDSIHKIQPFLEIFSSILEKTDTFNRRWEKIRLGVPQRLHGDNPVSNTQGRFPMRNENNSFSGTRFL